MNTSKQTRTYVMKPDGQNVIKIGKSVDPKRRLAEMQTSNSNKLSLVGWFAGDCESELHKKFADERIDGGEWFNISSRIASWLKEDKKLQSVEDLEVSGGNKANGKTYVWKCDVCKKPIDDGKGYIHFVDCYSCDRYATAQIHHQPCDPNPYTGDYWFSVESCRTDEEAEHWRKHLMHKNWFDAINWQGLIEEAEGKIPVMEQVFGLSRLEVIELKQ